MTYYTLMETKGGISDSMNEFENAVEKAFHTFGELQTMEDGIVADDMFVYKRRKRKNKDA